jgi:guanylate kinase
MKHEIAGKRFIEHAEVHGNFYGTSIESVEAVWRTGRICLLDIDIAGVKQVKQNTSFSAKYIFLMPPSVEVLEKRLRDRGTDDDEQIALRLRNSEAEMAYATEPNNFDLVAVNNDVDETVNSIVENLKSWFPEFAW